MCLSNATTPSEPRRSARALPWALCALMLLTLPACTCGQDQSVDRRGNKLDAGPEPPKQAPVVAEEEPNDSPSKANTYTLTTTGPGSTALKPFEGALTQAGDVDFIRIPAQPDQSVRTLRVEPLTEGFDPVILWEEPGNRQNLAAAGEAESALNLTGAEVVVGIAGVVPSGGFPAKYRVSLTRSLYGDNLEIEPAVDDLSGTLNLPGELQGIINHSNDTDRYQVAVPEDSPEGGALRLELQPPPRTAMKIALVVDGVELESFAVPASKDDQTSPAVWPNVALGSQQGKIEVVVSADQPQEGVEAAYTLRALLHPPLPEGQVLETEPSSELNPIVLQPGKTTVTGYLHSPTDTDVFELDLPKTADGDSPLIFHVRLQGKGVDWALGFDAPDLEDGALSLNKAGVGRDELICNRVVPGGKTRLVVSRAKVSARKPPKRKKKKGKGKKKDRLELGKEDPPNTNPVGAYTLIIESRQAEGEEVEPNGELTEASLLKPGASVQGFIFPVADVDIYAFEVKAAKAKPENPGEAKDANKKDAAPPTPELWNDPPPVETTKLEVLLQGTRLNLAIEVVDEEGLPVAQSDDSPAGTAEKLRLDLPEGKYFIKVRAGARRSSCDARYTLRLKTL